MRFPVPGRSPAELSLAFCAQRFLQQPLAEDRTDPDVGSFGDLVEVEAQLVSGDETGAKSLNEHP